MATHSRKTIFLTGATGNMGYATLQELVARADRFHVRALVRSEDHAHPVVRRYTRHPAVEWVYGDLTNPGDVLAGVTGADQVLHIGGLVSPLADHHPERTMQVNVGGARNIVDAIHRAGQAETTALVYIGTVAQTGHRNPPVHWGRTGDPIKISRYDQYAVSKTMAEAIVAQSGIRRWVSLRQTGIAHPQMWRIHDPIVFHNPWGGVFEWVTVCDSGRLAAGTCEDRVPETFWRQFYNIGGGEALRVTNHAFARITGRALGLSDPFASYRPHWAATRNFHGQWYADSDRLETMVPFRRETLDDWAHAMARTMPLAIRWIARRFPALGRMRMERLARSPGGPLYWIEHGDTEHINAFFGSRAAWDRLPRDWDDVVFREPSRQISLLDHGYDTATPAEAWTRNDLVSAATWRGGTFIGDAVEPDTPASFRCALGHDFAMTPRLYLQGGHWCPTCMIDQTQYEAQAARNPFFAQVWPDTD
jgi:nucleoside-diphosphate-sugar epimerase